MESFLNRYRSITVLLLVILAQLVLVAVQVKNDQDVRMIRVWTVTAVTPVARIVEALRGGSSGLHPQLHPAARRARGKPPASGRSGPPQAGQHLSEERARHGGPRQGAGRVSVAHALQDGGGHGHHGSAPGTNSKVVFVDRGTVSGVERGMAVVTPDGIVGKVITAYPTASAVLLITDPDFAAGVVSQKGLAHGTLKGQGTPICRVDYVPFEEKVEPGEWLYTSGDDRIFPRGFPVGVVKAVRSAQPFKEILVDPSGMARGPGGRPDSG